MPQIISKTINTLLPTAADIYNFLNMYAILLTQALKGDT